MLKTILCISGLIGAGVGAAILFLPVAFYSAANGVDLRGQISLLNETRAAGGGLLASGILIISGAFIERLTFTSSVVSVLVYLAYGMSRILSMAVDGMPASGLVLATALEIVVGLVAVFALSRYGGLAKKIRHRVQHRAVAVPIGHPSRTTAPVRVFSSDGEKSV